MTNETSNTEHAAFVIRSGVLSWRGACKGCPWMSETAHSESTAHYLAGLHVDRETKTQATTAPEPSRWVTRDEILDRLADLQRIADDALHSEYADRHRALERISDLARHTLSDSGR